MLKSLLTLLLSKFVKRSDTEFIGSQAAPSSSAITLTMPTTANLTGYGSFILTTAPFDGYATLTFTYYGAPQTFGILSGKVECKTATAGDSAFVFIPIKKGAQVDFYSDTARDHPERLATARACFVKNLGSA